MSNLEKVRKLLSTVNYKDGVQVSEADLDFIVESIKEMTEVKTPRQLFNELNEMQTQLQAVKQFGFTMKNYTPTFIVDGDKDHDCWTAELNRIETLISKNLSDYNIESNGEVKSSPEVVWATGLDVSSMYPSIFANMIKSTSSDLPVKDFATN